MRELLKKLSETFLEIEKTKTWMGEHGYTLDPNIEADRYRALAQKIHTELVTLKENQ